MKKVIFSLKPAWAEKILSGEKKVEFRKSVCTESVERILLYETSSGQKGHGRGQRGRDRLLHAGGSMGKAGRKSGDDEAGIRPVLPEEGSRGGLLPVSSRPVRAGAGSGRIRNRVCSQVFRVCGVRGRGVRYAGEKSLSKARRRKKRKRKKQNHTKRNSAWQKSPGPDAYRRPAPGFSAF